MKNLILLFALVCSVAPAFSQNGPAIVIGSKKNQPKPVAKIELTGSRKLSDFYFRETGADSSGFQIKSFSFSISNSASGTSPDIESHTDFFPDRIIELMRNAPPKSIIRFTSIKATSTAGRPGVELLPDLILKVTGE